jgi:hypothetical protein
MEPLIMVTLPMVSSSSSGGVEARPWRPPPLVVASLDSIDPPREWSLSRPTSLPCGCPFGLNHLHAQEMGSRTDTRNRCADRLGPTGTGPLRSGSVTPSSTWVLLSFWTWTPLIALFWQRHPCVQDVRSSRMKFGRSSPRECSIVTLRSLTPFGVISSCTWTRTGLLICSFELIVTPSHMSMFSYKNTTLPNALQS